MAKEAALELENIGATKSNKKRLILIGIGAVVALLIGLLLWFLLRANDGGADIAQAEQTAQMAASASNVPASAVYVPMPRPFLFNLPGPTRTRLVEIKVQLMVRGGNDAVLVQKHIPLIEDALLTTFSGADVPKLSTQAGKDELRQLALLSVQTSLQSITGRQVVEKVLFTGFVMQ